MDSTSRCGIASVALTGHRNVALLADQAKRLCAKRAVMGDERLYAELKDALAGSGMAGLGAAYRLHSSGAKSVLFDQHSYLGGHTASHQYAGGWTFDEGPHISFSKEDRIKALLAENIGGDYQSFVVKVNNYWKGHWIKHPAQVNLHGLPVDLVARVLEDFIAAQTRPAGEIRNYEDW